MVEATAQVTSTADPTPELSIEALVDAGAHIGCRVNRWNPKMEPFIFGARNRIHIIDLRETIRGILRAKHFLREMIASGQDVLFVGTKPQIRGEIKKLHDQTSQPYVDDRWIGGTLTNYDVIGSRIAYLEELETKEQDGSLHRMSSKAASRLLREKRKVDRNLHGIREMFRLPGALVIVDPRTERNAVREARKMGIPIVGIVDTDGDPGHCELVIPANDDAIRSVALILAQLIEACREGMQLRKERGISEPRRIESQGSGTPTPRPSGGRQRPGGGAGRGRGGDRGTSQMPPVPKPTRRAQSGQGVPVPRPRTDAAPKPDAAKKPQDSQAPAAPKPPVADTPAAPKPPVADTPAAPKPPVADTPAAPEPPKPEQPATPEE